MIPYYPIFIVLIAIGAFIMIQITTLWSSYSILVNNEQYITRRNNGFWRQLKKKLND